MTWLGRLSSIFPLMHVLLMAGSAFYFITVPTVISFSILLAVIYVLPPFLLRIYTWRFPVKHGKHVMNRRGRCDWWVAHQLQLSYQLLPFLEGLLRLIPGCYSLWLRLWGSRIGRRVYWTVNVEIVDRHLMDIGDDVIFGHLVKCCCHVINKKTNGDLVLTVRPIRIGEGSLIGAEARISLGVSIPAHTVVPHHAKYKFRYVA